MNYIPYIVYSQYSIQKAFSHIEDLVKRAVELKLPALALTDQHTLSGIVEFVQEIEKSNKKQEHKIKPIIGCQFNVITDGIISEVILLAQNERGWRNLIRIMGRTEFIDGEMVVKPTDLAWFCGDLICIHLKEYSEDIRATLTESFRHNFLHQSPLAPTNYNLPVITCPETYYVNKEDVIFQQIIICSDLNLTLADKDLIIKDNPHYAKFFDGSEFHLKESAENDSSLQLLDLVEPFSISNKPIIPTFKTESKTSPDDLLTEYCRKGWVEKDLSNKIKDTKLKQIYIDRIKEELDVFTKYKLSNYMLIIRDIIMKGRSMNIQIGLRGSASGCLTSYLSGITDIDPVLPDPTLPYDPAKSLLFSRFINAGRLSLGEISFEEYPYEKFLKEQKEYTIDGKFPSPNDNQHIIEECEIIDQQERGWEYYHFLKETIKLNPNNPNNSHVMKWLERVDKLDINKPVKRTKENFSLPDCDCDVGVSYRPHIIKYVKDKYGEECVGNIITFGRMDGKGAIKETFRVLNPVSNSFEVANIITNAMIDTSKIQDELEDLKEDNPKYNSINYCIDNIKEVEEFSKEYKKEFEIAIKLASTINFRGKHAAGLVISDKPLNETFPTTVDPKTGNRMVALEMADLEYVGGVKFDLLSVAAYEKIDKIIEMVNKNLSSPIVGAEIEEE